MINEILEVQTYLKGENIQKNECTFRMCTLLAKYFHSQGWKPVEIRERIFKWANTFGIHIKHNVNDVIKLALNDGEMLRGSGVYLSEYDILEIKKHFDNKNVRLCALALLLYAKAHADENGEFKFNQVDFGKWVGIQQPHVSEYFDELEMFEYIEKICPIGDQTFLWNGRIVGKKNAYKIKVPYCNEGEHFIENNNVREIYNEHFGKTSR